ncbi:hypothetical protein [Citrobacter braakii]|uniref:hypothetical protein n=1 Tax=Citrobacter braakii TaxID=57706 RepID=UPI0024310F1E|nr:hypothetical protein [Citrobacter braakii]WFX97264.1 hypothetical protein NFK19_10920 [Citrobacter braakii]WFY06310.1 hypothetical protein NFK21_10920 [Citrobacter braakii]
MTKITILVVMFATIAGCTRFIPKDCQKKSALGSSSYNRSGKVTVKDIYGKQA